MWIQGNNSPQFNNVCERWTFYFSFVIFMLCSELELKPQGLVTLTIVKANNLKNMEMIGKSDPYVTAYIRPLEKFKTKVVDNNLNPVWNHVMQLIAEDKETQFAVFEVKIFPSVFNQV